MFDDNLMLVTPTANDNIYVTRTTTYTGPPVLLNGQTSPWNNLVAYLLYKNAANASGSNSLTFKLQESDTNVSGDFTDLASAAPIALSTTVALGEVKLTVSTKKKYVRLVATLGGGGSGGTADIGGGITLGYI